MELCIDFDGTCVTHDYPKIGKNIGAIPVLKKLIEKGHNLILFTMRSGKELQEAVNWFNNNNIPLYGINENPTQKSWTLSPKAYGQVYIDDASIGCPLIEAGEFEEEIDGRVYVNTKRPYVDWKTVEKMLRERGIL